MKKIGQKMITGFQVPLPELINLLDNAGYDVSELRDAKIIEVGHTNDGTGAESILIKVEKTLTN